MCANLGLGAEDISPSISGLVRRLFLREPRPGLVFFS